MRIFQGTHHDNIAKACALTVGTFDGMHRGHQAMLALLHSEARQRGLPSCVVTFEPHPRDYFARASGFTEAVPARIATLRDKVREIERCGIDQLVVMRFDASIARQTAGDFVDHTLVDDLKMRYLLVGDDFRFGAGRTGTYAMVDAAGTKHGFDVARVKSYEVHGERISGHAIRNALSAGDMPKAEALLGRPYCVSGRVTHGAKLGRQLGFRTLNLRCTSSRPAALGIFAVRVHGLDGQPLDGVASLGVRPTVDDSGRLLLETHCFRWPTHLGTDGGYGKTIVVDLLHKIRDEARFDGLDALQAAIRQDVLAARNYLATYANPAAQAQ